MVLADTCIWIDFFRGKNPRITSRFRELIRTGQVALAGVVLAEVIQGISSADEQGLVVDHFLSLTYFETTRQTWEKAGTLSKLLRSRGITVPLTDLVLAAIAIENDIEVYTTDSHFTKIPGLRLHHSR